MSTPTRVSAVGAGEYTGVTQDSTFENITGLVVVPRAASGSTPKVIRVHGDYGLRRVRWSASRNGRPPLIPAQEDLLSDDYLGGTVTTQLPVADPMTGGFNFGVQGEYLYFQSYRARKAGVDPLPCGSYPYPLQPQDAIAQQFIPDALQTLAGSPSGYTVYSNPIETLAGILGAQLVDHNKQFPWPFTAIPVEAASTGLIGG